MHKLSPMLWFSAVALVASSLGCTMCSTDHLCDYAGVGGKWQRANPTCGRVGSILSDAGDYDAGGVVGAGAAYGDSLGLVEGYSVSTEAGAGIESDVVDNGVFEEGEIISEEVIDGDEFFEDDAGTSSIMIGQ